MIWVGWWCDLSEQLNWIMWKCKKFVDWIIEHCTWLKWDVRVRLLALDATIMEAFGKPQNFEKKWRRKGGKCRGKRVEWVRITSEKRAEKREWKQKSAMAWGEKEEAYEWRMRVVLRKKQPKHVEHLWDWREWRIGKGRSFGLEWEW